MAAPTSSPPLSGIAAFTNEWSALLECASPSPDRQRLSSLLRSADWTRFLALAEEHGVVGHIAACLGELPADLVPPQIRQTLINRQRSRIFLTLRLTAELFCILDRFSYEGIGALVVKGPALAMQAYGDPSMRTYGDLDLLVRQRDIRRATELMIAAGYAPAVALESIDAGKIPGQYLFSKLDSKLLVELHNDCTLRYFPRRLPLEELFARQIQVRLDAREAPALSVEDELLLICIHGTKHFWERLIWIADVAALVSRQTAIDWGRVADSAKAVGGERMLHTGLRLATDLLKAQLPGEVLPTVQKDVVAGLLALQTCKWLPAAGSAPPGLFARAAFRLRMRGGLLSAPAYLFRLSFSPTEEDWEDGAHGKGHWFIEAARRPFRLARKHSRGGKV
jgi:hypothetical protein